MLEQVLAQPAQPLVLPDLSYPNYSENSDNPFATPYHIAPSDHPHLFSDRPRSYLVGGLSSIVSSALEGKLLQRPYSASLQTDNPELPKRDHEAERREYERQLTDSPALSPPASSPSSATHRSAYNYEHRPSFDRIVTTPSPDAMYNHPRTGDSITPNDPYPNQDSGENANRTSYNSRPSPLPSIITANLLGQTAPADPYSESPLSSPSDVNHSSFSHPDWQFAGRPRDPTLERYTFPQHSNPILDRRMSEPIIRSLYHATHPDSYQYLSAQADSPSTAATVVPPTPHSVSPRPPTLSYSSYPSFAPHHQRAGSGTSIGSGSNQGSVDSWVPLKHPHQQAPTEQEVAALGGSPSCSAGVPPSESAVQGIAIGTSSPSSRGNPQSEGAAGGNGTPGSKNDKKTYSFVSLPGNAVKKRPRRRYDEIERLYQCNYPNCTKSYGTLNHLNAHVTMQKHGSKRSPGEFKELRKQWRQAKKEAEEHEREREREARAALSLHASHQHPIDLHPHLRGEGHLRGDGLVVRHGPRRRISLVDPYPDPHGFPPHHHSNPPHAGGLYGYGPTSDSSSSQARFGMHSPVDELRYPPHHLGQEIAPELPTYYRQQQQSEAHGPGGGWHTSDLRHHQQPAHHGMSMSLPSSRPIHQASYFHHQASHSSPAQYSLQQEQQQPGEEELEEPLLTSHVSLGSNRLPPDSTLLTPLPGFVPDAEHAQLLEGSGGVMGAMGPGMSGGRYDPSYGMGRDREDF